MNTNVQTVPQIPTNDPTVALKQRQVSQTLGKLLSPLEVRIHKALAAYRNRPMYQAFCNVFERNLDVQLSSETYVWSDILHLNTELVKAIDGATDLDEAAKNHALFWLCFFHVSYFAFGYQQRLLKVDPSDAGDHHMAFIQAVLVHMQKMGLAQPGSSPVWQSAGYVFQTLPNYQNGVLVEDEVLVGLDNGSLQPEKLTQTPLLSAYDLPMTVGSQQDYQAQPPDAFANEMLNDWLQEITKSQSFGAEMANNMRLLYFKAKPPRDASEAIMDCLKSRYPLQDDLSLYHTRKLAHDYYAPRMAEPQPEKTGHIELFLDASGSISAADIGDAMRVFTNFFAKRKKKMTYGIHVFDTTVKASISVDEKEDPNEKIKQLAVVGGGGTDFRSITAKVAELQEADPHYKCDLIVTFTDLCGTFPDQAPADMVWVTTTRQCHLGNIMTLPIPGTIIYV